jgi:ribosomal protein S17E
MSKSKFQINDRVDIKPSAPKWVIDRVESFKNKIAYCKIINTASGYGTKEYTVGIFDKGDRTLTHFNVRANAIELATGGMGNIYIDRLQFRIDENSKAIEKLQLENQRLRNRIQLVLELKVDSIDEKVLNAAEKIAKVKNIEMQEAYELTLALRDFLK